MTAKSPNWNRFNEPPSDVIPGLSDLRYKLVSSADKSIDIGSFEVWPVGVRFGLLLRVNQEVSDLSPSYPWLNGSRDYQRNLASRGNRAHKDSQSENLIESQPFDGLELGVSIGHGEPVWVSPNGGWSHSKDWTIEYSGGTGFLDGGEYNWWISPLPVNVEFSLACRWNAVNLASPWVDIDTNKLAASALLSTPTS